MNDTAPTQLPEPGWYPDPDEPDSQQRYWDGSSWSEERAPRRAPATETSSPVLVGAGYVGSILVLPGLMIGAALLARKDRNGLWVLGLSLFFLSLFIVAGILGGDDADGALAVLR